jgi:hypothetical protein
MDAEIEALNVLARGFLEQGAPLQAIRCFEAIAQSGRPVVPVAEVTDLNCVGPMNNISRLPGYLHIWHFGCPRELVVEVKLLLFKARLFLETTPTVPDETCF